MEWSAGRKVWNGQGLDSPDPFGSLKEHYLSRLMDDR